MSNEVTAQPHGIEIKIPIDELKKRSLFLAVPMYSGICHGMFSRSMADLSAACYHYGIKLQLYYLFNESLITRARAYACDEYMRSDCSHMMFIDSDIGFNPQDVIAMLAMQSDDSPYDILGAVYPKKCISFEKLKQAVDKGFGDENPNDLEKFVGDFVFNPKSGSASIPINQPVEVMETGTGFMMIKRKVFETFDREMPHLRYRPDHVRTAAFDGAREIMMYFDCEIDRGYNIGDTKKLMEDMINGVVTFDDAKRIAKTYLEKEKRASKRYLSEDYLFCQNAARLGHRTYICPWMKLQHVGSYVFGGSLADLAQIGAAATADLNQLNKIKEVEKRRAGK